MHQDSLHFQIMGSFYGFPDCCNKAFQTDTCWETKSAYADKDAPWVGTGYLPCMKCAPHARVNFSRFVEERINPARICPSPFPLQADISDKGRFLEERYYAFHENVQSKMRVLPPQLIRGMFRIRRHLPVGFVGERFVPGAIYGENWDYQSQE